mmetsp:Transcript_15434/g.21503  ORF Transcript_15434/g.21503 Transcript_15434/m.21503 type:complete len:230 (+) Transcript_15434:35-724(+)
MFLVPAAIGGSLYYTKNKKGKQDEGGDDGEIVDQDDVNSNMNNDLENSQFSEQTPITFTEEEAEDGEDGFMIIESPTSRSTTSTMVGTPTHAAAAAASLGSSNEKEQEELMSSIDEKIEKEIQARKERESSTASRAGGLAKAALAEVCTMFTDPYPDAFPPTIPSMPQKENSASLSSTGPRLKPRKQHQEGDKIPVNIAFGKFAAIAGSTVVNMIKDPLAQNPSSHQNP